MLIVASRFGAGSPRPASHGRRWGRRGTCRRAAWRARACPPGRSRLGRGWLCRGAVVVDGQSYLVSVTGDGHGDAGGVAGVASSVGDGLLGQAVDRGPDRGAEVVELAGERHLDEGVRLSMRGELLDLGHAGLRRELGLLGGTQDADDGAQLGEGAGRRVLDGDQGLDGALGVGGRDGPACLGLDGDARDMVGDGVVQLAGELFTLARLGLVDVADTDPRAEADRGAERCG